MTNKFDAWWCGQSSLVVVTVVCTLALCVPHIWHL